jgi:hypothetical protein
MYATAGHDPRACAYVCAYPRIGVTCLIEGCEAEGAPANLAYSMPCTATARKRAAPSRSFLASW